jgi:hypothetical protein
MKKIIRQLQDSNFQCKNILEIYKQANNEEISSGKIWYKQTNEISRLMAVKYNLTVIQTSGIIAALSPGTNWNQNIIDANNLCSLLNVGKNIKAIVCTTYNQNKFKASYLWQNSQLTKIEVFQVLLGCSKKVNKTSSFFLNILNPEIDDICTIDRHAYRINLGLTESIDVPLTEKRYLCMNSAYKQASKQINISSIELQAITWLTFRRLNNIIYNKQFEVVPF